MVTSAIGAGAKREVLQKTDTMGSNLLVVRPARIKISAARKTAGYVTTLKPEDCRAIAELDSVADAVPGIESMQKLKAGPNATSALVMGTSSPYLSISRLQMKEGRFFSEEDERMARRVAVLGTRVATNLFDEENPVGRGILIRDIPFEVIGITQSRGVMADGSDLDNQVTIPIRTALRRLYNSTWLNPIMVSARDAKALDSTEMEIADLLRNRHRMQLSGKPDDFSVQNKTRTLNIQKQVADSLSQLALALAGISLLIGGTGILAVMLMSVKQRRGEIGLRMAIGATSRDVLSQFLLEAVALASGGWGIGMIVGALLSATIAYTTQWKVAVSGQLVFSTLGLVLATGIVFGAYPARKAALVPPIQALVVK
jgi:putative ABC transport system permease protein